MIIKESNAHLPNFRKHRKTTKKGKKTKKDRDRWPDTFSRGLTVNLWVSASYHVGVCPWRTFPWAETKKERMVFPGISIVKHSEMLPQICSAFL